MQITSEATKHIWNVIECSKTYAKRKKNGQKITHSSNENDVKDRKIERKRRKIEKKTNIETIDAFWSFEQFDQQLFHVTNKHKKATKKKPNNVIV